MCFPIADIARNTSEIATMGIHAVEELKAAIIANANVVQTSAGN